jgi:polysaccharide export outer membrane protein
MAVTRVGRLLAGLATLLGLGIAGTGCLSLGSRSENPAAASATSSRPTFSFRHTPAAGTEVAHLDRPLPVSGTSAPVVTSEARKTETGEATASIQRVRADQPMPLPEGENDPAILPMPNKAAPGTPPAFDLPGMPQNIATIVPPEPGAPPPAPKPEKRLVPMPHGLFGHGPAPHHGPVVEIGAPRPMSGGLAVPKEFEKRSLSDYVIEPPDILLVQGTNAIGLPSQPIEGQHLVKPDGKINLGIYGEVYVAGMTIASAKVAVAALLKDRLKSDKELSFFEKELQVDVIAFNSKFYYIITDGGGYGEAVYRIPITGNETVLDALSQINGLPVVASKKRIWVARATPNECTHPQILPVDWCGITKYGSAKTNYQIFPGDRIYVQADHLITIDSWLAKILNPIERVTGAVLLGSATANSIRQLNK